MRRNPNGTRQTFRHFTISATKPYRYGIPDASYCILKMQNLYGGIWWRSKDWHFPLGGYQSQRRRNSVARNVGYSCVTCQLRLITSLLSGTVLGSVHLKSSSFILAGQFQLPPTDNVRAFTDFQCTGWISLFKVAHSLDTLTYIFKSRLRTWTSVLGDSNLRCCVQSTVSSIILKWFYSTTLVGKSESRHFLLVSYCCLFCLWLHNLSQTSLCA